MKSNLPSLKFNKKGKPHKRNPAQRVPGGKSLHKGKAKTFGK